ncbi:hypothetical protein BN1723_010696, partial [Verticillium longisporum]
VHHDIAHASSAGNGPCRLYFFCHWNFCLAIVAQCYGCEFAYASIYQHP